MVHELSRRTPAGSRCARSCSTRRRPTDLLDVVRRLTAGADRPDRRRRAKRRSGAVEPARVVGIRAVRPGRAARRPGAGRAARHAPAGRGHRAVPGRDGRVAGARDLCGEWRSDIPPTGWRPTTRCRQRHPAAAATQGPLPARELPDTCAVPWRSSGLDQRPQRDPDAGLHGAAAARSRWSGARGPRAAVGPGRAGLSRTIRRCRPRRRCVDARPSAGCASLGHRPGHGWRGAPGEPLDVGEAGEPAVIEGVRGQWRVDPAQLGQPFDGRAALLSPLDRLVFDRKRLDRDLRVRLPAGDVQAGGQPPVGLLRAADPVRRPAGRARSTRPPTARPGCCGSTRSTRT